MSATAHPRHSLTLALAREAEAAMRVADYLAQSTAQALDELIDRVHEDAQPVGLLLAFEGWQAADDEAQLQMGEVEHAARHLFARMRRGGYASPAAVAQHLQALPPVLQAAAPAWHALRTACQTDTDLIAACDAYAARRAAQDEADARMCSALHRLVLELDGWPHP